jgi:hypothetical protein
LYFLHQDPILVSVRSEDAQYSAQGHKIKTLKRRIFAKFQRGIPEWCIPLAESTFDFSHIAPEMTAQQTCGFYDSEADQLKMDWTDEERKAIEDRLLELGYFRAERPLAPLPYPAYEKQRKVQGKRTVEHVIDDIRSSLDSTGLDAAAVISYEADHFDKDSQAIIDAFPTVTAEEEVEEMVVA